MSAHHGEVFAQRELQGLLDDGVRHSIAIWIERRTGGQWAVGRVIDGDFRSGGAPASHEYVSEGRGLAATLEAANLALEADRSISALEGLVVKARPFGEHELVEPLERWLFGSAWVERRARAQR